jgi:hypothetical protein
MRIEISIARSYRYGSSWTWPWIGEVIGISEKQRFLPSAVFSHVVDEDGFLMQKVRGRPNWEGLSV